MAPQSQPFESGRSTTNPVRSRVIGTTPPDQPCLLTINAGSSSLKFALFEASDPPRRLVSGKIERIGLADARWSLTETIGGPRESKVVDASDGSAAAALVLDWLDGRGGCAGLAAVGHRVVHGESRYSRPVRVTAEVIAELRRLGPLDPDHLPAEVALMETFQKRAPGLAQVACFDTAFHAEMPRVARIIPIPRRFEAMGIRRYGFHGLSYSYLMEELARVGGIEANGRVILAHLGSGASMAAVRSGRPIETTMGFTPTAGLVMGTRTGDIDPGLVAFLATAEGISAERFGAIVNHESGLLGVSETSPDIRDLLARQADDPRAAEAVELFCYRAKCWIGSLAAALGGLDTLVFSGGIGENAVEVRRRICEGLGFLGISLDDGRNAASAPIISTDLGAARVRVIATDEESIIARAAASLAAPKS